MNNLAKYFDHTALPADTRKADIIKICEEAKTYGFTSVAINPYYVPFAKEQLAGTDVLVGAAIGFPLGATTTKTKLFEIEDAIENGAGEVDMVINIGAVKDGNYDVVEEEITAAANLCRGKIVFKIILETCLLTNEEKIKVCEIAKKAQVDFVKTSTGFNKHGATVEDVKLMRETVGPEMGVKASGGIRNFETAQAMIEAGATRLGSSASVKIVNQLNDDQEDQGTY
ncbi:deoxyribose-phosphate aldolase [Marinicrinis sediminis]|uniref:Deoxyribose-phosphate aldolase n=1 Tax=Marinicrinis sediminis TaxID=1652465 RepID=A0ABW5RB95_9BACL